MSNESAAAILVQTIFDNNEPLRNAMMQAKIPNSPEHAVEFIKPFYVAMFRMVQQSQ